jgi:L-threonylcarbamoyladenylate synthase
VIDEAVTAIQEGRPVILPTDTVYGLCADPYGEAPARELYRMKGTPVEQPIALVARDLDFVLECVPELRGRSAAIARALLPGPFTLVLPNPGRRYAWITGSTPDRIGVRVPELAGPAAEVFARVGAVVATSANLHGGPDPRTVAEVPVELRAGAAAVVDGGELPGTPSTVLDLTGDRPQVLREGAVQAVEAVERALAAAASSIPG